METEREQINSLLVQLYQLSVKVAEIAPKLSEITEKYKDTLNTFYYQNNQLELFE